VFTTGFCYNESRK